MKLMDLPEVERPRERLIKYGVENLSNEDLISILLRCGSKGESVKELSSKILSKINNINNLNDLGLNEFMQIKGIGKAKALTLISALELGKRARNNEVGLGIVLNNTKKVYEYFSSMIKDKNQEHFLVILLNNKKRLISYKVMYIGSIDSSVVSIKEVMNYAVRELASGFIIMHNHPSGECNPSSEDINITNDFISSGKLFGIYLLDHIIVGKDNYYSFFEENSHENK